jgi:hypothetical protein
MMKGGFDASKLTGWDWSSGHFLYFIPWRHPAQTESYICCAALPYHRPPEFTFKRKNDETTAKIVDRGLPPGITHPGFYNFCLFYRRRRDASAHIYVGAVKPRTAPEKSSVK